MKSGNLAPINLCVPSICFTDSPSFSGCCCKAISRKKKNPANTFSETHTYDMQVEILTVVPSHIHTHAHAGLGASASQAMTLPLRLKVEPHRAVAPVCTSGGAAAEGRRSLLLLHSPHHPQPHYKSHLTVSVIIPHMLVQQSSSQAK